MSDSFWLTDEQIARLQPYFPKSPGRERVDDRRVLSGIIFVNRNGLRWRDAPTVFIGERPETKAMLEKLTAQNRFALTFRLGNIKTEAGRKKKIADFVAMLKRGETFYPQKALKKAE